MPRNFVKSKKENYFVDILKCFVMVLCLIVGCSNKSGRSENISIFRVPTVVINQGKDAEELSKQRRSLWISAISRNNITETIKKTTVYAANILFLVVQLNLGIDMISIGCLH